MRGLSKCGRYSHPNALAMTFAFPPAAPSALPIAGEAVLFPIRRVFCVGRNYAAHAREMGGDPTREAPFFFAKPADAVVAVAADGTTQVHYPPATAELHHEVELVIALGAGGADLSPAEGAACVMACGVGIDLTRRDIQAGLKAKGQPWEMAKAFDESAPVSPLRRIAVPPSAGGIWLDVNGARRQAGDLCDMIWNVGEIVGHLSRFVRLAPGDLIFTGTPEGVGPLQRGDHVRAGIEGVAEMALTVV